MFWLVKTAGIASSVLEGHFYRHMLFLVVRFLSVTTTVLRRCSNPTASFVEYGIRVDEHCSEDFVDRPILQFSTEPR